GPVYDASRLVLHAGEPGIAAEGAWEPLSNHVVRPLLAGMAPGFAATAGGVAWWAHNLSVLVMLNFLPLAKHFHVITSLPNVFFRKLEPLGALSKQDLENATTFGTSHIDQFTWKQVLDMFSCTECGRCSSQCPATATGKPLAPRQLLLDLRDYLYAHQDEVIEKRFDWAQGLGVPSVADKPNAEYLYYVGCAGAFDDRNKKTTQAFARLL